MRATFQTFTFGTIHVNETHAHFVAQNYIVAICDDGVFRDLNGHLFRIIWPTLKVASPDAILEVTVTQVIGRAVPREECKRMKSPHAAVA